MSSFLQALALALPLASVAHAQVTAAYPNGETNPDAPFLAQPGAAINQTSMSRLLTLNGIDDFCLYGPPDSGPDSLIGNVEPIVVAYCLKPRNNARLIPDGTIQSAHFIKTSAYVQIQGFFDGTKINIPYGDDGGELDPHGAENLGNPIGGNVTSNVSGQDVFYEEWMSFMSYNQFCLRVCISETPDVPAALMCEHELDVMGCQFVMPGDYTNNSFTSCDGEPAVPPGLYPQPDGSTSTFRQFWSHTLEGWTVGQTVTPAGPYSTPATSNCQTFSTISNGIDTALLVVPTTAASSASRSASSASATSSSITSSASISASTSAASARSSSASAAASAGRVTGAVSAAASASSSAAVSGAERSMSILSGAVGYFLSATVVGIVGGLAIL
ncbi:hypothetical protein [Phaffia rhodozyma]|uniref:Uncharacterized protein n=1 Tax=Phaffia rhodozyma TaxID=264483 RepID=A0A0F7STP0_PHARH|nr:hypothetical protein [Phaffia rhodozyma]